MPNSSSHKALPFMFVLSDLDDLGLDPYAFRLLGRIARRAGAAGYAFESQGNMAQACRMSRQRANRAIATLRKLKLILLVDAKRGRPHVYRLNLDRESWKG